MVDYTPNRWILDEIAANRKWMVEMMDGMPTECLTSCAKEIESLRAELAKRTEERDEALKKIDELEDVCGDSADRMVELVKERDEARREICERVSTTRWKPQFPLMSKTQYAEERGWDCYKENTHE